VAALDSDDDPTDLPPSIAKAAEISIVAIAATKMKPAICLGLLFREIVK